MKTSRSETTKDKILPHLRELPENHRSEVQYVIGRLWNALEEIARVDATSSGALRAIQIAKEETRTSAEIEAEFLGKAVNALANAAPGHDGWATTLRLVARDAPRWLRDEWQKRWNL